MGMAESGSERVLPPLQAMMHDKTLPPDRRITVAHAVAQLGDGEGVDYLLDAFWKLEPGKRTSVVFAFGDVGDARALPLLEDCIERGEHRGYAVCSALRILTRLDRK